VSTAIIAHADRDGIAASALLLKHRARDARVFPVGRASDVAQLLTACSQASCPERIFVIGYPCSIEREVWNELHKHNPRVVWIDHHLTEWQEAEPPPRDMVQVILPLPTERNAPAAMVAEYLFGSLDAVPEEDRVLLRQIYEIAPADDIIDFIDGLHISIRGVEYSEMTDFVRAVLKRRIPSHYESFLRTARSLRTDLAVFLADPASGCRVQGSVVLLPFADRIDQIPRAVASAWARRETEAKLAVLRLRPDALYINMRHDLAFDLRSEVRSVPGLTIPYSSGHPYVVYVDGVTADAGRVPADVIFSHLVRRISEIG
jgi:hypothetical protein